MVSARVSALRLSSRTSSWRMAPPGSHRRACRNAWRRARRSARSTWRRIAPPDFASCRAASRRSRKRARRIHGPSASRAARRRARRADDPASVVRPRAFMRDGLIMMPVSTPTPANSVAATCAVASIGSRAALERFCGDTEQQGRTAGGHAQRIADAVGQGPQARLEAQRRRREVAGMDRIEQTVGYCLSVGMSHQDCTQLAGLAARARTGSRVRRREEQTAPDRRNPSSGRTGKQGDRQELAQLKCRVDDREQPAQVRRVGIEQLVAGEADVFGQNPDEGEHERGGAEGHGERVRENNAPTGRRRGAPVRISIVPAVAQRLPAGPEPEGGIARRGQRAGAECCRGAEWQQPLRADAAHEPAQPSPSARGEQQSAPQAGPAQARSRRGASARDSDAGSSNARPTRPGAAHSAPWAIRKEPLLTANSTTLAAEIAPAR